jgi:hypothetical protein
MGCGSSAGSLPMEERTVVHGDIFNSETRTVLAILKICEVQHNFRNVKLNDKNSLA